MAAPSLSAQSRVVHTLSAARGLQVPPVWSVTQDKQGFLWSGAEGGLFRFDGHRMVRWAPESLRGPVTQVLALPEGGIVAATAAGQAWRVEGSVPGSASGVHPFPLPEDPEDTEDTEERLRPAGGSGAAPLATRHLAVDAAGVLWLLRHDRLWRGEIEPATGQVGWTAVRAPGAPPDPGRPRAPGAPPDLEGRWADPPILLFGSPDHEGVLVATREELLVTSSDGTIAHRLGRMTGIRGALPLPGGGFLVARQAGAEGEVEVLRLPGTPEAPMLVPPERWVRMAGPEALPRGRLIDLVLRRGTAWISLDRYLVGIRPGAPADVLDEIHGVDSGGPLFVDAEETLWIGSFTGLVHLPEPETRTWRERDGLPSRHARFVARTGSTLWVLTWQGSLRLAFEGGAWVPRDRSDQVAEPPCGRPGVVPGLPLDPAPGRAWGLTPGPAPVVARAGAMGRSAVERGAGRAGDASIAGWTAVGDTLFALASEGLLAASWLPGGVGSFLGCAQSAGGGLWIATREGTWLEGERARPGTEGVRLGTGGARFEGDRVRLGADGAGPEPPRASSPLFPMLPAPPGPLHLEDEAGRLWAASPVGPCWIQGAGRNATVAGVGAGADGGTVGWACEALPDHGTITDLAEVAPGSLWVATSRGGVFRRSDAVEGARWVPLVVEGLPSGQAFRLVPSPRGGIWVVANGLLARVAPEGADPPRILETLSRAQGLAAPSGSDLVEDESGTIWIASARGLTEVPAQVRFAPTWPPPLALVEHRSGRGELHLEVGPALRRAWGLGSMAGFGRRGEPGGSGSVGQAGGTEPPGVPRLRLARGDRQLSLGFAALSFRDPGQVRHQVRVGAHAAWEEIVGEPRVGWTDLANGLHRVEYRASVDGLRWSDVPLALDVRVTPSWYASTPFRLLLLSGVIAGGWLAYRARVAHLVELERQRTRIALDLHDQVGSGLASVGLLSAVLAQGELDEAGRQQVAREVEEVAEELGVALSDIVWTLDPRVGSLPELAGRLTEHGERLLGRRGVEFQVELPARWPAEVPAMAVRRGVFLVVLEGLHNAARHAGAQRVTLTFGVEPAAAPEAPLPGGWWVVLEDDGIGFEPEAVGRGRGLEGQRHRAAEIGARLTMETRPGGGTRLRVEVPAAPRGVRRWLSVLDDRGRGR